MEIDCKACEVCSQPPIRLLDILQGYLIHYRQGEPRNVSRRWHEMRKLGMKSKWSNNNLASQQNSISFHNRGCSPWCRVARIHSTKYGSSRSVESAEKKKKGASFSRVFHKCSQPAHTNTPIRPYLALFVHFCCFHHRMSDETTAIRLGLERIPA